MHQKYIKIILIFLLTHLLACQPKKNHEHTIVGETQGTTYTIKYIDQIEKLNKKEIDSLLSNFDNLFSTYHQNSLISKLNKNQTDSITDTLFVKLFTMAKQVATDTDGMFDFTVDTLLNYWRYETNPQDTLKLKNLKSLIGYQKVDIQNNKLIKQHQNIQLNFNAIAQGYSVDILANYLDQKGINNYLIEIGGELKAKGHNKKNKLWTVGIDQPSEDGNFERNLQAVVELNNEAIATSGNYRKFYFNKNGEKISHFINPKTMQPANNEILSISVVANSCALADAYATAFLVMGKNSTLKFLKQNQTLKVFMIYTNGKHVETFSTLKTL